MTNPLPIKLPRRAFDIRHLGKLPGNIMCASLQSAISWFQYRADDLNYRASPNIGDWAIPGCAARMRVDDKVADVFPILKAISLQ